MTDALNKLVALLELETLEETLFRGQSQDLGFPQLYGGQVLGQALAAAARTVPDERRPHSQHGYFLRPGDPHRPVVYQVDTIRDGGDAKHDRFPGHPIEFLHLTGNPGNGTPTGQCLWFRLSGTLPDDPALHRHLLSYASDFNLLTTSLIPHGIEYRDPKLRIASLDHALWLHQDTRLDDWLLYVIDSPWAGGARGLARGHIYSRDGRLVASTAQEGLTRYSQD